MKIPELNTGSTAIFVRNIDVSKRFYCDILQLQIQLDFGKNVIFANGFAIWEIRNDHIIPKTLGLNNITGTSNRFELYFETEDLSSIHESLVKYNVKFLHEIHEEKWGQRTIRFFDPDDHLIEIGESMRQFITRFYKQGMTPAEISARTSVPAGEVNRLLSI